MQESPLKQLLRFSVKHAPLVIILLAGITAFLGYFAVQVNINSDVEKLIPESETVTRLIEKYTEGSKLVNYVVMAVESEEPFTIEKLKDLYAVIEEMEALPRLSESMNPFTMITFGKAGSRLKITPMAPEKKAPSTEEELEVFKKRLLTDPFAESFVVSENGKVLCVFFPTVSMEGHSEFHQEVERITERLEPHYTVYLTGTPLFISAVEKYLARDMTKLIILAVAVILAIYYLSFRALRASFLSFLVVVFGTIWCLGIMELLGYTITVVSIVTPPLVLTLGSSYTIHILNQYFRETGSHLEEASALDTPQRRKESVVQAVFAVNKTVILAAGTTIIGLFSLLATSLEPTREFGIVTSIGIFSCAFLSFFFLPAALSFFKAPTSKQSSRVVEGPLATLLEKLGSFVIIRRVWIIGFAVLMVIGAVICFGYLTYKTDVISYFPAREKVVRDTKFISEAIGGTQEFYITITAPEGEENYFLDPENLGVVADFEEVILADKDVTKVLSVATYIKQLNKLMRGNEEVPETKGLILLLARYINALSDTPEADERIKMLISEDYSRLTLILWAYDHEKKTVISDRQLKDFLARMEEAARDNLPEHLESEIWGEALRYLYLSRTIKHDQRLATALSILFVFILTAVAFRRLRFGFYALIPLLSGITLNIILMVVAGIPMDMTTVMFSIVVIGVGVDNSIHFLIQFRKQRELFPEDLRAAIARALKYTGRPIVVTSFSIVAGFLVLTFASFQPIVFFGILVALALLTAMLGTLIILPAILSLTERRKR